MHRTPRTFLAAALVATAFAGACAEERPPIDQVQPNALPKSFFVGADFHGTADDPEFWAQGTLIDVGYGAAQDGLFTSTYAQPLTRIKWIVQEDLLIGRLTYERIADSDGKGAGAASDDGVVVVAFPIVSHFDIRRAYNTSTGEELNVLVENSTDRPWWEREFMRVDWSRNLNVDSYDFDTLSQLGIYGGVSYEPLAYYVSDPHHPDAPHFDVGGGYFDVTTKAFARPQMIDLARFGGEGQIPACWFDADLSGGSAPSGSCNPVELTVRQAFRRVEDSDYEPAEWDGHRFQAFGAFTADRYGYARNYGMADTKWHRMIARYDIWERSHFYRDPAGMTGAVECFTPQTTPVGEDPHRDTDADGTEDECRDVGSGSRCDTFRQKCTLPYRERVPTTLAWYYTSGSHPDYFDGTEWATHEWDVALRASVLVARYEECRRTGGGPDCAAQHPVFFGQMDDQADAVALAREVDDCRHGIAWHGESCEALAQRLGNERGYDPGVVALAQLEEMIVLCHSPVEAGDPQACGSPRLPSGLTAAACHRARQERDAAVTGTCAGALEARRGDLRYHQVTVVESPQTPSPWGIMTDAVDPLTGEKVSASINVWSHVTDLWSQGVVDVSRYVKGELATDDVTEGRYVREWAAASEAATRHGALPPMTRAEVQGRLAAFGGIGPERLESLRQGLDRAGPVMKERIAELHREVASVRADATVTPTSAQRYAARRALARGTPMEAALTTRPMQEAAGVDGLGDPDAVLALASPLRGMDPALRQEVARRKELALAERGACVLHEAPAPLGVAPLADALTEKFGPFDPAQSKTDQLARAERMRRWIAQRAHFSVVAHEMGHSIALRHNFVSSADAWGYRPQYWQLRTENGAAREVCGDLDPSGSCIGPRYFDPITENERKNLLPMFMQSTTMDYAGESTQDLIGLGAYDFAAARMFYADVVSVHADPSYVLGSPRATGMMDKLDGFGGIVGMRPTVGAQDDPLDAQDLHYSELQNAYDLIWGCADVDPVMFRPASWNDERDGAWHPLLDGQIVQVGGRWSRCKQQKVDYVGWTRLIPANGPIKGHSTDAENRLRLPYGFATDRWADLGNLSVYRHDNGADPYELFDFLITQQEVGHIFDNYRRARQGFSVRSAEERTLYRFNTKLRDGAKGLGLLANIYRDFAVEIGYAYDDLWPVIASEYFGPNILASQIAFDHFARQLARPEAGPHYQDAAGILRSDVDTSGPGGDTVLVVPNGATGYYRDVAFGGRPVGNALADDKGEYDSEYTVNAGSYYDKAWTAMLMTESVDNFISDSRRDFVDARYRNVSMADLFPDGYRRWLANNLTGDDFVKGPRIAGDGSGRPAIGEGGYPLAAMGWTSWWQPGGPRACFTQDPSLFCSSTPGDTLVLDPQVGFEQQKFLIALTLQYLPENQQQTWLNMLRMWELGADSDPGFDNRIELHHPSGKTYIAKTFGTETIFGRTVQQGIAARMLEWGNELLRQAYVVSNGPDLDGDGRPDWYEPVLGPDGIPQVRWDRSIAAIDEQGFVRPDGKPGCNDAETYACTCSANRACVELDRYAEVPFFLRQAIATYGLADPSMKGIY